MKLSRFFLCLIVLLCFFHEVSAEEDTFRVVGNNTTLETFNDINGANDYYLDKLDEYDNLLLYKNDKLIQMEYGLVQFDLNEVNEYHSIIRDEDDYLCGGYGVDGAYLNTDIYDGVVYFAISGDRGYVDLDDVNLIAYEQLAYKPSLYHTDDKYLYHNIKSQLVYEYYATSLKLDFIPEYLESNTDYYSYDGHYFYTDFYSMINDYRNDNYSGAINSDSPYYNYYQYLPYRSLSNYSYQEVEDYFYNTLGINSKLFNYVDNNFDDANDIVNCSQLYGEIDNFFTCQNVYGCNSLLLLSSAINESNYGKTLKSYSYNNLFNNAAYEYTTLQNKRFETISDCIYSYSKYLIGSHFSNHNRDDYQGTYAGNKVGGINIEYSLDQYYGEKLAATYFNLDNSLGLKDYQQCCIGIIDKSFNVYSDENLTYYKYHITNNGELAYVILAEYEDSYLIQLDDYTDDYQYDFAESCGYIAKDVVTNILNDKQYTNNEFVKITYDFSDGNFNGYQTLSVNTRIGDMPIYIEAEKDGYEFIGYDQEFECANEPITYTAIYKQIDSINIAYLFNSAAELYPYPDLSKAYLNVKYSDGTNNKIKITSEMLSYFDKTVLGEQEIYVNYCGLSVSKVIEIDDTYINLYDNISDALNCGDVEYLKNNLNKINYPYTMTDIRKIDNSIAQVNKRNYVINDHTGKYDLSISGLDLSLADKTSFSFFKDTYYVEVKNISSSSKEEIYKVANGYGFEMVDGINLSFKFNFEKIELNGPIVVQLDIENKDASSIYSVYHLDDEGNVIKCRSTWSNNYVQFIANESGDYLILSKKSVNTYNIEDTYENLSFQNMGYDNHKTNLNILCTTLLLVSCLIGVIIYYIIKNMGNKEWKDYKRLLQRADIVQEEKRKN